MYLQCDERPSDSPYVERVWHAENSGAGGPFVSMADPHWELVVSRILGRTAITVRGPETQATPAYGPPDAEYFGIQFKPGAFMPDLPVQAVMDRNSRELPEASGRSFYLLGSSWEFPTFDNADTFVSRLVHEGLLVFDPLVGTMLDEQPADISLRTAQRRFLRATGLTFSSVFQIRRARYATLLLQQGRPILDVVAHTGYFDQPHLTRALRQYIGHTPAQIGSASQPAMLSFLYKNRPF